MALRFLDIMLLVKSWRLSYPIRLARTRD